MTGKSRGEELMDAYLDIMLPLPHVDNYRSDEWLRNPRTGHPLELDRFYPTIGVAFEFQGDQHYRDTFLIGDTLRLDKIKCDLCEAAAVYLIPVKAVQLQTTVFWQVLRRMIRNYKQIHPETVYQNPEWFRVPHDQKNLWSLDHEAKTYREYLRKRFPATMTARKPHTAARAKKQPWRDTWRDVNPTVDSAA